MDFDLRAHTHLLVLGGSRAHGMHRPDSDVDLKGFAVPPAAWLHGFALSFEQADGPGDLDGFVDLLREGERDAGVEGSVFALAKLAALAADCNPHVLEILFCRDDEVRFATPVGSRLRAHARAFLSRRARHSFGGYAAAQLKRIEGHRRWLLDPPGAPPERAAYGLPEHTLIPRDQLAAAEAAVRAKVDSWEFDFSGVPKSTAIHVQTRVAEVLAEIGLAADDRYAAAARSVGLDENFVALMERERRFKRAAQEWRQYQGWKESRNPERAALEAAHGYDTKHGAHLVRLLRMAREILETGEVHVWRGDRDADELRAIRAGAWPYERLLEVARAEEQHLRALDQRPVAVPERVDRDMLNALIVELTEEALAAAAVRLR